MTERQEQLIALHEEEKRRRTLSPRGLESTSPTMQIKGWRDAQTSPSPSTHAGSMSSPVIPRQRQGKVGAGEGHSGRDRPSSWPPLVVVNGASGAEAKQEVRTSSGSYFRHRQIDGRRGEGGTRDDYRTNKNNTTFEPSMFPSVPKTIVEENEDEEGDSSDLDFY